MDSKKEIPHLTEEEIKKIRAALGAALEIYGKGNLKVKQNALSILEGWGRIAFVISNDGKRIGLELTERWERERKIDKEENIVHP